jgi:hypothetical protein
MFYFLLKRHIPLALRQFLSPKASSVVLGSPVLVRNPYFTVPYIYFFSFQIPCCRQVCGRVDSCATADVVVKVPSLVLAN